MSDQNIVLMQDVGCPLGCKQGDEIILTGHDLLHDLPGEFTVVKCQSCGLMRTNPRPTPETMGFYYPDDYGPYIGTRVKENASNKKSWLKKVFQLFVNSNTTRLPNLPVGRMLELGCASGAFLHEMANKGWQVEGIEFSERAAKEAEKLGYKVYAGSLETAPTPDEKFDLIVGWMVIEHLHEPVLGLKKLAEWTHPRGYLVFSVPNAGSLEFKIFKDKWYALQVPTHLYHYTAKSIKQVLKASGWRLIKIHHQRVLGNLIASLGYELRGKGFEKLGNKLIKFPENAGKWNYILYPFAWFLSLFGQTGRMTVWAERDL